MNLAISVPDPYQFICIRLKFNGEFEAVLALREHVGSGQASDPQTAIAMACAAVEGARASASFRSAPEPPLSLADIGL